MVTPEGRGPKFPTGETKVLIGAPGTPRPGMATILVTGGAGFLGEHLVTDLARRGHRVRSLDVLPHAPAVAGPAVETLRADVRDARAMREAARGVDVVVHNAALVPITRSGHRFWEVNVDGTRRVLEAAEAEGVRKVVYVSSSSIHGRPRSSPIPEDAPRNPLGRYGRSKAAAEEVCDEFRARGLDVTCLRPRPILGPGRLGILEILFDRVRQGRRFYVLGSGANRFQLVSVHDLLQAIALAATKPCRNMDFNVGAKDFTTLRGDLEALAAHAGTGTRIVSIPEGPVRGALRAMDVLRLSPFVSWHYETIASEFWYATDNLERILGWTPRHGNAATLAETYDWYLANRDRLRREASGSPHRSSVKTRLVGAMLKLV